MLGMRFRHLAVMGTALMALPVYSVPTTQRAEYVARQERQARRRFERRARSLNRSRHWAPAETYKDARRISPYPDRPVR